MWEEYAYIYIFVVLPLLPPPPPPSLINVHLNDAFLSLILVSHTLEYFIVHLYGKNMYIFIYLWFANNTINGIYLFFLDT